ncbi:MAG: hypothetical protein D3914_08780, partial [Candidatus Electrothrix sp. LOE2]|nr:hypothetical protein [Candidatus Electrothrix sp. LOE2]
GSGDQINNLRIESVHVHHGKQFTAADIGQDFITGHIIIGSVFRDGSWHTAVGSTHIQEGNRAIVICNSDYLKEVRKMFTA